LTNQITGIFKLSVIPASVLAVQKLLAAVSIDLAYSCDCQLFHLTAPSKLLQEGLVLEKSFPIKENC
jgi:hypothetical protein